MRRRPGRPVEIDIDIVITRDRMGQPALAEDSVEVDPFPMHSQRPIGSKEYPAVTPVRPWQARAAMVDESKPPVTSTPTGPDGNPAQQPV